MADQRKLRQDVGLENMNMTSNYNVTNNAHQMQMTPYTTEWNPLRENFLRTLLLADKLNWKHQIEKLVIQLFKSCGMFFKIKTLYRYFSA